MQEKAGKCVNLLIIDGVKAASNIIAGIVIVGLANRGLVVHRRATTFDRSGQYLSRKIKELIKAFKFPRGRSIRQCIG